MVSSPTPSSSTFASLTSQSHAPPHQFQPLFHSLTKLMFPASSSAFAPPRGAEPKNSLIQYCQKSKLPLPVFHVVNEGPPHAPRFRSTVWVNGKTFASENSFQHRRAAEQDVAKLALEQLPTVNKAIPSIDLRKLVSQEKLLCKSIVYEFAVKMNMGKCTYETVRVQNQTFPMYVSSLVLNGIHYRGEVRRRKKEAEQQAAQAAILSLLDDPTYVASLSEVVMHKLDVYNTFLGTDLERNFSSINTADKASTIENNVAVPCNHQMAAIEQNSSRVVVNTNIPETVSSENTTEDKDGALVLADRQGPVLLGNEITLEMVNSQAETHDQVGHVVPAHEQIGSLVLPNRPGDAGVLDIEKTPEMVNSQTVTSEQGDSGVLGIENMPEIENSQAVTSEQGDSGVLGIVNMPKIANSQAVMSDQVDSGVLGIENTQQMVNSQANMQEQVGHVVPAHEQSGSHVLAVRHGDSGVLGNETPLEMANTKAVTSEQVIVEVSTHEQSGSHVLVDRQGDSGILGNETKPEMVNSQAIMTSEQISDRVLANDNETLFTVASCHAPVTVEAQPPPHESLSQQIGSSIVSTSSATMQVQNSVLKSCNKRRRRNKKNNASKRLQTQNE